jgi:KDO2-lipid IV(A) lauroyltransferase
VLTWLAADQTPPEYHNLWMEFLNRETIFYSGPAYIPLKFGFPVFFQKTMKKSRGHYETSFELLFENPLEHTETEILQKFILKMEEVIKHKPEYYLWSHKRWKHQRTKDN